MLNRQGSDPHVVGGNGCSLLSQLPVNRGVMAPASPPQLLVDSIVGRQGTVKGAVVPPCSRDFLKVARAQTVSADADAAGERFDGYLVEALPCTRAWRRRAVSKWSGTFRMLYCIHQSQAIQA